MLTALTVALVTVLVAQTTNALATTDLTVMPPGLSTIAPFVHAPQVLPGLPLPLLPMMLILVLSAPTREVVTARLVNASALTTTRVWLASVPSAHLTATDVVSAPPSLPLPLLPQRPIHLLGMLPSTLDAPVMLDSVDLTAPFRSAPPALMSFSDTVMPRDVTALAVESVTTLRDFAGASVDTTVTGASTRLFSVKGFV